MYIYVYMCIYMYIHTCVALSFYLLAITRRLGGGAVSRFCVLRCELHDMRGIQKTKKS